MKERIHSKNAKSIANLAQRSTSTIKSRSGDRSLDSTRSRSTTISRRMMRWARTPCWVRPRELRNRTWKWLRLRALCRLRRFNRMLLFRSRLTVTLVGLRILFKHQLRSHSLRLQRKSWSSSLKYNRFRSRLLRRFLKKLILWVLIKASNWKRMKMRLIIWN